MSSLLLLIPTALILGLCGVAAFMWTMKSNQYDDLDGAANRILLDDDVDEDPAGEAKKTQDPSPNTSR